MSALPRSLGLLLPISLVLAGCGDDGRADESTDGISTDDEIGTDDDESASESADASSTMTTTFDETAETDTECSPCGSDCCGPEEMCDPDLGVCTIDCGDAEPCVDPAQWLRRRPARATPASASCPARPARSACARPIP
ncbi:MAG: hypothetical protein HC927_13310 [Deltaproteobacteria bacterium]|nr:hypothetical protein [Deltaproteobacteria bacterium]